VHDSDRGGRGLSIRDDCGPRCRGRPATTPTRSSPRPRLDGPSSSSSTRCGAIRCSPRRRRSILAKRIERGDLEAQEQADQLETSGWSSPNRRGATLRRDLKPPRSDPGGGFWGLIRAGREVRLAQRATSFLDLRGRSGSGRRSSGARSRSKERTIRVPNQVAQPRGARLMADRKGSSRPKLGARSDPPMRLPRRRKARSQPRVDEDPRPEPRVVDQSRSAGRRGGRGFARRVHPDERKRPIRGARGQSPEPDTARRGRKSCRSREARGDPAPLTGIDGGRARRRFREGLTAAGPPAKLS